MARKKQPDLPLELPRMPAGTAPSIARPRKRQSTHRRAPKTYSKEFFDLYLTEVPNEPEYDLDARPAVVEMLASEGYGLRLTIHITLDTVSLELIHPRFDEPREIAFSDHAHWHPHVLRVAEMEAICAAARLTPYTKQASHAARVLLSTFTVCTVDEGHGYREAMEQSLGRLGFSADEIRALREERAFFSQAFGPIEEVGWRRRGSDWIVCGDGAYSFREASEPFPHGEFGEVIEQFA